MDDAKIDQIAREVLASLRKAHAEGERPLEAEPAAVPRPPVDSRHPSLLLMSVPGGVVGSPCIIEPDKVCVGSLRCRTFGH
jgi:hypothetical protein